MHEQDNVDRLHFFFIILCSHLPRYVVGAVDAGHASDLKFKLDKLFYLRRGSIYLMRYSFWHLHGGIPFRLGL